MSSSPTPVPVTKQVGILVLDNDVSGQGALRQILDSEGWRVSIVAHPHLLLAELRTGEWALVVANVAVTGLDSAAFLTLRELAAVVTEDYGGDASRIWSEAADTADLQKRIGALPGFGKMKVMALGSVLAKQFGVKTADPLVPAHACLGEVDSPEALKRYQSAKREHKAKLRAAKG